MNGSREVHVSVLREWFMVVGTWEMQLAEKREEKVVSSVRFTN